MLAPVNPTRPWRFLLGFLVLYGVLASLAELDATGRYGLLIMAAVLLAAVAVERLLYGVPTRDAPVRLGLGRPSGRAIVVALLVAALIQAVYPLVAGLTGERFALRPGWPWLLIGTFAFHGVAEELVWRGYAYGHLREGRSFGRAVAWTMPLIAATHVYVIAGNGWMVGLAAITVAAVTTVPFARLYELGRRTIWAPALLHTGIDSFKIVSVPAGAQLTFSLVLAAASILVPLLVLAVPLARRDAASGGGRKRRPRYREDAIDVESHASRRESAHGGPSPH
jgi:membrane protease YdiL (CAAX protease family)